MTYNGRRGPNVSQYLRDLNTVTPEGPSPEENFHMEDDLALFTNTQFFDFDSGQNTDFQAQPGKSESKPSHGPAATEDVSAANSVMGDMSHLDFMGGDFNFTDFSNSYSPAPLNGFADGAQNFQTLQPNHGAVPVYGQQMAPPHQGAVFSPDAGQTGDKHQSDAATVANQPMKFEEPSRQAAEEDKRRRNTAASARFRIKKKQREQALEKSAKEMTDKLTSLESKVSQLETENKWLKNLLVEKNESKDDISALWKEFTKHAAERTNAKKAAAAGKGGR